MSAGDIDRVTWLVAHHHSYDPVDSSDHQILIEADFLVNLYEDQVSADAIRHAYEKIFRTETGRTLCRATFGLEDE